MFRSTLICSFAVILTLFSIGCAETPLPMPSAPSPEPNPSADTVVVVQMCVPGKAFLLDARYMVVKTAANQDLLFHRVDYRCKGDGIEFDLHADAPRETPETCEDFRTPGADAFPGMLFLVDAASTLPAIYTRVNVLATIFRVVTENPCGDKPVPSLTAAR